MGSLAGSMNGSAQLTSTLSALHNLHTEANRLRPDDRAVYLQEIKDVGGLLAYIEPETSVVSGFLDQQRRIALAQQINAAILSECLDVGTGGKFSYCSVWGSKDNRAWGAGHASRNPSTTTRPIAKVVLCCLSCERLRVTTAQLQAHCSPIASHDPAVPIPLSSLSAALTDTPESEGRPVQSHLEQIVRRTHAIYATLHEHGIPTAPSWTGDAKGAGVSRI